jgi:hypothetical protein
MARGATRPGRSDEMAIGKHHDDAAQPDEGAGERGGRDTPGADAFAIIRESHVPWADDAPVVREDEHYERVNETAGEGISPRDRVLLDEFGGEA